MATLDQETARFPGDIDYNGGMLNHGVHVAVLRAVRCDVERLGLMREVVDHIRTWQAAGEHVAIATVLTTVGSTPRPAGAKMAITAGGKIVGSISGGCVDTDVIEHAVDVLRTGRPQIIEYGYSPDMSWEVGLMCGGSVQVFVEPLDASPAPVDATWLDSLSQGSGETVCGI